MGPKDCIPVKREDLESILATLKLDSGLMSASEEAAYRALKSILDGPTQSGVVLTAVGSRTCKDCEFFELFHRNLGICNGGPIMDGGDFMACVAEATPNCKYFKEIGR